MKRPENYWTTWYTLGYLAGKRELLGDTCWWASQVSWSWVPVCPSLHQPHSTIRQQATGEWASLWWVVARVTPQYRGCDQYQSHPSSRWRGSPISKQTWKEKYGRDLKPRSTVLARTNNTITDPPIKHTILSDTNEFRYNIVLLFVRRTWGPHRGLSSRKWPTFSFMFCHGF
jgi:hypothetical protein